MYTISGTGPGVSGIVGRAPVPAEGTEHSAAVAAAVARATGEAPDAVAAELARVPPAFLSPDTIIALMQRRLRDINEQVSTLTTALQDRSQAAEDLSGRLQELRAYQEALRASEEGGHPQLDGATPAAYREHGATLHDWGVSLGFPSGTDMTMEAVQTRIDGVNEQLREVNSDNEMLMIQLQSAMQQRTQIIQLGSNMLKAFDEGTDTIVGNMR